MTPDVRHAIGRVLSFAVVGGIGFVVDAGTTEGLVFAGASPLEARVVAIAAAILTTFLLNRTMTFRSDRRGAAAVGEGGRYLVVALAVAAVNYAIYAALVIAFPGLRPVFAVVVATGFATVLSYLGYSRLVFGARRSDDT